MLPRMLFTRIPAQTLAPDPIALPGSVAKANITTITDPSGGSFNLALVASAGAGPMNVEVYGCLESPPEAFLNAPTPVASVQWFLIGSVAVVASGQLSYLGSATLLSNLPSGQYYIRPTTGLSAGAFVAVVVLAVGAL